MIHQLTAIDPRAKIGKNVLLNLLLPLLRMLLLAQEPGLVLTLR